MADDPHRSPPRWLAGGGRFGGNLQTIWPALFSRRYQGPAPVYERERWTTPDGHDFIDLDWQREAGVPGVAADSLVRPLLVLFHGLEGSSHSHYAEAFANWARQNGWRFVVPHFRGCSGELNLAPRSYHSGDFEEVGWVLERLRAVHSGPMVAAGVSLGGNALMRWAQEAGDTAARLVGAVCAISAPLDLPACGHALGLGFNRQVYTRLFLRSLVPKAVEKARQFPGLIDTARLRRVRSLREFDDLVTGPLHGFHNADDYWTRAAAKPHLHRVRIPTLVVNALNDPFVPARSLPQAHEVGAHVTLWQPGAGGHVGFAQGRWPGHLFSMPEQVMDWMSGHVGLQQLPAPPPG
jgi:predicted alpha/beta-fold hydrolase